MSSFSVVTDAKERQSCAKFLFQTKTKNMQIYIYIYEIFWQGNFWKLDIIGFLH